MARVSINFSVTPSAGVQDYWVTVGTQDVPIKPNTHKGSLNVSADGDLVMQYFFTGNPGDSLLIVGEVDGAEVVKRKGTIPSGETQGAGHKRFTVKV